MRRSTRVVVLALGMAFLAAPGRADAGMCNEPVASWQAVSPESQGMDAGKLARALHSYQDRRGWAVRIYRNGCLVMRDTNNGNEATLFESWEITGSVLALVAARQMTLGLLSADDVVGSLVPEADAEHGAIRVRDLLQRASGLAPHADNVYMRDRLRLALTRGFWASPGRRFGDAPEARSLLIAVLQRAAKEDVPAFAARELLAAVGIGKWRWTRDRVGNPAGTFGLQLTADDLGRLGELVLRDGRWRGRQLIDPVYLQSALTPSPRNPCFGWLVWLNSETNCSGSGRRLLPGLPRDLWSWAGNQDQRVTGIPSLHLLVVRYGLTASDAREGTDGLTWERDSLLQLVAAVKDTPVVELPDRLDIPPAIGDPYRDDLSAGLATPPDLPRAGPRRARVPLVRAYRERVGRKRLLGVRIACPAVPDHACSGTARLIGVAARERSWSAGPGATTTVMFRLKSRLRAAQDIDVEVHAEDGGAGVTAGVTLHARR